MWNLVFMIVGFVGLLLISVVILLVYLRVQRYYICPKCKHLRQYPKGKSEHENCTDCTNSEIAEKEAAERKKRIEVRYQKLRKLIYEWLDRAPAAQSIEEVDREFKPIQILNGFQLVEPRQRETIIEIIPICDAADGLAENVVYSVPYNDSMRSHWRARRFISPAWAASIEDTCSREGRFALKPHTYDSEIWHLFSKEFYYNQIGVYVERNCIRRIKDNVAIITIFGESYVPN